MAGRHGARASSVKLAGAPEKSSGPLESLGKPRHDTRTAGSSEEGGSPLSEERRSLLCALKPTAAKKLAGEHVEGASQR
eukprot:15457028-Alexandrium_andersonii.AAC.1